MVTGPVIAIEGASAAGKTTVADAAGASTGWTVIPEAYRRLVPPPSLDFRTAGELLRLERTLLEEEARRYREAFDRARAGATVIVDSGFLGPLTYSFALVRAGTAPVGVLTSVITEARALGERGEWGLADAYVYLDVPPEVRAVRAAADPAGAPAELAARHRAMGSIERSFYLDRFAPRWGPRFRVLPAARPPAPVAEDLVRIVREFASIPRATVRLEDGLALLADPRAPEGKARGNR